MSRREKVGDPLPEEFASYEEAAEFWDTHDTADYPDAFEDAPVEVRTGSLRRRFEIEVEEDLIEILRKRARKSGTTVRQLTSELLRRQLVASS